MEFNLKVEGLDRMQKALHDGMRKLDRPITPMRAIGVMQLRSIARNFAAEGRPIKWPKLKRKRRKGRRKGAGRPKLLRDTGVMFNSITFRMVPRLRSAKVIWGTNVPYAICHQKGIGVPKREFLLFHNKDITYAERVIKDFGEGIFPSTR